MRVPFFLVTAAEFCFVRSIRSVIPDAALAYVQASSTFLYSANR